MKTFIIIFFAYLILSAIIAKIPVPKKKKQPRTITKTVVKVIPDNQIKSQHVPNYDEIEYQRERLQDLYNILDITENRLSSTHKDTEREKLLRQKITVTAQIRRAQKIISKELTA